MFYFDKIEDKKIVRSDLIKEIDCFFTTRDFCVYPETDETKRNREILCDYLKEIPAMTKPVHGITISKVIKNKKLYENTDGLFLDESGSIAMYFGDCVPLVFYCDGVVMVSHAGWRGTVQQMARHSIQKLVNEYNFSPKDIKVVIGPAICKNCYNVGEDVYQALYQTVNNNHELFAKVDNLFFVDLKGINKQQLIECGVEKIDVCPYCTACGEKLFFSYRCENQTKYRHSVVVKL